MTDEQKEMLANGPEATETKGFFTKKRVAIGAGLLVGAAAVYFIGPKVLLKVKPI